VAAPPPRLPQLRNYRRLHVAGVRAPAPVLLKSHVLVMEVRSRDDVVISSLDDEA
jgi:serine/threonine-protein kinase RIO1